MPNEKGFLKKEYSAKELQELDEDTIRQIRIWRNQPFVRNKMFSQHIIQEEEHQKYVEEMRLDENRGLYVQYLGETPFAVTSYKLDKDHQSAELGDYLIREEYQSLGYGAISRFFVADFMFFVLHVETYIGEVIENNQAAMRVAKHFGAKIVDRYAHEMDNGKTCMVCRLETSRSAWMQKRDKIQKLVGRFVSNDDLYVKNDSKIV